MARLILVRVDAPQSMTVALEVERESRERTGGAEPDKAIGPLVHGGLKVFGVSLAHRAVESVGAENQVGIAVDGRVLDVSAHLDAHAQVFAALGQIGEQLLPGQSAEAVAARSDDVAAIVDADVVPMTKFARQRVEGLGISCSEVVLRRIREDDPE